jgi:N-acetylglutamate synthase-like GNAT family acetyltransferase
MNRAQTQPRRATLEDVNSIAQLVNTAFEGYIPLIGRKPLPMTADHNDLIQNHDAWVLEEESEIIAVLELVLKQDSLYIDTVAVKPSHQSRGLGKQLLKFSETRARELGRNATTLFTNERYTALLEMYARHGYVETHRVHVQGTDAVHLRKPLKEHADD